MKNTSLVAETKLRQISIVKEDISQQTTHSKDQPNELENPPKKPARLDPTRYGDWEKNGRCIDF